MNKILKDTIISSFFFISFEIKIDNRIIIFGFKFLKPDLKNNSKYFKIKLIRFGLIGFFDFMHIPSNGFEFQ